MPSLDLTIMNKANEIVDEKTDYSNPKEVSDSIEKIYNLCLTDAETFHVLMDRILVNVVSINLPEFKEVTDRYKTESWNNFYYA